MSSSSSPTAGAGGSGLRAWPRWLPCSRLERLQRRLPFGALEGFKVRLDLLALPPTETIAIVRRFWHEPIRGLDDGATR